jgi:hypothetical protein
MNARSMPRWRRAALLASAILVAVGSSAVGARPVAASAAACDTVSLTAAGALEVDVVASACGAPDDATYTVTAELFERRTSTLVGTWSHAGGGTALLVDATVALVVGGWYDLVVTSFSAVEGQQVQEAAALAGDGGRPTIDAPVLGFRPAAMKSTSFPAAVRWVKAGSAAVARYQVQRSVDGGAFAPFGTTRATSLDVALVPGHRYAFRVRGVTGSGLAGPWRATVEQAPRGIGDASTALVYGGTWRSVTNDAFWGDRAHRAGIAGRSVQVTFMGGAAAIVAAVGPSYGSFRVYVDGVYRRTVRTYAAGTAYRRVVYGVQWVTPGTHTVRLEVVGTAGHPRVDVDGILVLRELP